MPELMRALRQEKKGGSLVLERIPVPEPGPGEVLVKMAAAPINPSDLASIREDYMGTRWPFTPGLEGSGTVVKAGKGLFPALRQGKRVACSPRSPGDGTWAEYMCTPAMKTVVLPASLDLQKGSMLLVNPMTAVALLQIARRGAYGAVVHNAAASSLGKMLIRLFAEEGLPLVSIVRRAEQVESLKELGAAHVLNSSDAAFHEELKELSARMGTSLILDAVTGPGSARLLSAAPRGSTLLACARLSGEDMALDPALLIKEEKRIEGFQLGNWLSGLGLRQKLKLIAQVKRKIAGPLSPAIRATFALEDYESALEQSRKEAERGKVLLLPGQK